jgi:hypothetical protein
MDADRLRGTRDRVVEIDFRRAGTGDRVLAGLDFAGLMKPATADRDGDYLPAA